MISFETVPILEPDFKLSFTSICKVAAYITLIFFQCWLCVVYKMFRYSARKKFAYNFGFDLFPVKNYILIPFGMPSYRLIRFCSV